ncbi:hypothetical protein P7K49_005783 [Saguinus oedipus]|uniref:Uncharacterized protein n=1 Tax=Saguinus oedipus TaxID=9490 RepID=A0ABQ9W0I5_SAGOE|nr:hypothetical protein P7K49_005783 [Saguinus oedipus]
MSSKRHSASPNHRNIERTFKERKHSWDLMTEQKAPQVPAHKGRVGGLEGSPGEPTPRLPVGMRSSGTDRRDNGRAEELRCPTWGCMLDCPGVTGTNIHPKVEPLPTQDSTRWPGSERTEAPLDDHHPATDAASEKPQGPRGTRPGSEPRDPGASEETQSHSLPARPEADTGPERVGLVPVAKGQRVLSMASGGRAEPSPTPLPHGGPASQMAPTARGQDRSRTRFRYRLVAAPVSATPGFSWLADSCLEQSHKDKNKPPTRKHRPHPGRALHVTLEARAEVTKVSKWVQVLRLGPAGLRATRGWLTSTRTQLHTEDAASTPHSAPRDQPGPSCTRRTLPPHPTLLLGTSRDPAAHGGRCLHTPLCSSGPARTQLHTEDAASTPHSAPRDQPGPSCTRRTLPQHPTLLLGTSPDPAAHGGRCLHTPHCSSGPAGTQLHTEDAASTPHTAPRDQPGPSCTRRTLPPHPTLLLGTSQDPAAHGGHCLDTPLCSSGPLRTQLHVEDATSTPHTAPQDQPGPSCTRRTLPRHPTLLLGTSRDQAARGGRCLHTPHCSSGPAGTQLHTEDAASTPHTAPRDQPGPSCTRRTLPRHPTLLLGTSPDPAAHGGRCLHTPHCSSGPAQTQLHTEDAASTPHSAPRDQPGPSCTRRTLPPHPTLLLGTSPDPAAHGGRCLDTPLCSSGPARTQLHTEDVASTPHTAPRDQPGPSCTRRTLPPHPTLLLGTSQDPAAHGGHCLNTPLCSSGPLRTQLHVEDATSTPHTASRDQPGPSCTRRTPPPHPTLLLGTSQDPAAHRGCHLHTPHCSSGPARAQLHTEDATSTPHTAPRDQPGPSCTQRTPPPHPTLLLGTSQDPAAHRRRRLHTPHCSSGPARTQLHVEDAASTPHSAPRDQPGLSCTQRTPPPHPTLLLGTSQDPAARGGRRLHTPHCSLGPARTQLHMEDAASTPHTAPRDQPGPHPTLLLGTSQDHTPHCSSGPAGTQLHTEDAASTPHTAPRDQPGPSCTWRTPPPHPTVLLGTSQDPAAHGGRRLHTPHCSSGPARTQLHVEDATSTPHTAPRDQPGPSRTQRTPPTHPTLLLGEQLHNSHPEPEDVRIVMSLQCHFLESISNANVLHDALYNSINLRMF